MVLLLSTRAPRRQRSVTANMENFCESILHDGHFEIQVSDWTSVLIAFPLTHCWILPSNLVDCVVPKNHAELSTLRSPGSPLTFLPKSPTDLKEIIIKGEVVAPHHHKGTAGRLLVSSRHPGAVPLHSQLTRCNLPCTLP